MPTGRAFSLEEACFGLHRTTNVFGKHMFMFGTTGSSIH